MYVECLFRLFQCILFYHCHNSYKLTLHIELFFNFVFETFIFKRNENFKQIKKSHLLPG